jgi:hypothetical protein
MNFDKWDLQSSLGVAESKLYKLKDQGNKKSVCTLLLNRILEKVREKSIEVPMELQDKFSNFISNSSLNLRELNTKTSDVLLLKQNKDQIEQFIIESGYSYTLSDLLGTEEPLP